MTLNIARRKFIAWVGGAAASSSLLPLSVHAQPSPKKVPVVGVLWHAGSAEEEDIFLSPLRKAFNDLGYIEGKNIILEHRFPAENPDRFRTLARELVAAKVDALIGVIAFGAVELKKLTSTIPIVFVVVADPVGDGLVESLARPGGNATGLSFMMTDLSGKRLSLLKEAVPHMSRVAYLTDPADLFKENAIKAHQAAAEALGLSLWPAEIKSPDDIEPVFSKIIDDRADGVAIGQGPLLFSLRAPIGAAAISHRLPTIAPAQEFVRPGLLMSYGPEVADLFRRAAAYIDKILKGAKPADLPVEQPTNFKLAINLKTAKALDITIPQTLLLNADVVIE
jgi:putative tryptophan/tyrosine transport system substrate-binding protein